MGNSPQRYQWNQWNQWSGGQTVLKLAMKSHEEQACSPGASTV